MRLRHRRRHAAADVHHRRADGPAGGDHAELLHWSDLFATGGEEIRDEVVEAVRAYSVYILDQVAERRGGPARTWISLIVNADDEQGPLSDVDLVFETMLVLVGGDERRAT